MRNREKTCENCANGPYDSEACNTAPCVKGRGGKKTNWKLKRPGIRDCTNCGNAPVGSDNCGKKPCHPGMLEDRSYYLNNWISKTESVVPVAPKTIEDCLKWAETEYEI